MHDLRAEVRRRLIGSRMDPVRELEIVEEIALDLDERRKELLARGATETDADRHVLAQLDDHDVLKRELAAVTRPPRPAIVAGAPRRSLVADLWTDFRYGARALMKSPGFTAVTLISLALGVGANTAIFQLLDAIHLRAVPVSAPEQLAEIRIKDRSWASGSFNSWHAELTNPMWERIRDRQEGFTSVLAWGDNDFNISPTGEVKLAKGIITSGGFFTALKVPPLYGRVYTAADDVRGCGTVGAVVSHGFWQRELGGDPGAVGRKLVLDGHDVELLGVAPPGFTGLEVGRTFDIAVPLCMDPLFRGAKSRLDVNHSYFLSAVGRLKPGWTLERATAQLDAISPALFAEVVPTKYAPSSVEKFKAYRLGAFSAATGISNLREEYTKPLYFLLATAALVLLIACANLANLLLARASAREREIAVRLALGASRGRLIRQLMTESLLLALLGGAAGLWLAGALSRFLVGFLSTRGSELFIELSPDWRVLAFTLGVAALTCLLFGLAPALRASRTEVGVVLKATGGRGTTLSRFGLRRMLVATQVALSFVLLVGALLFARSLRNLATVDTGFDERGVLVVDADLRRLNLPADRINDAIARLTATVAAAPGVAAAANTSIVPISGSAWNQSVGVDGKEEPGDGRGLNTYFTRVSPGYLDTIRVPLIAGRDIGPQDTLGTPVVGLVNQTLAKKLFAGESPIGKRLRVGASSNGPPWTIDVIGLVGDIKYNELREENRPLVYLPALQEKDPYPGANLVVRASGNLGDAIAGLKKAAAEVSPLIVLDVDVWERMLHDSIMRDRLMATLSGFFGLLAALLATIGLYGVVAYGVSKRRQEIGIRMALGADHFKIAKMIVRETAGLLAVGLAAGVVLALAAMRLAASMLYGLASWDPLTFAAAVGLLAVVTLVAAAIPARRASRIPPMTALKEE